MSEQAGQALPFVDYNETMARAMEATAAVYMQRAANYRAGKEPLRSRLRMDLDMQDDGRWALTAWDGGRVLSSWALAHSCTLLTCHLPQGIQELEELRQSQSDRVSTV
jgi:hypothetical protein